MEVGVEGIADEVKDVAALLVADGDLASDAPAPMLSTHSVGLSFILCRGSMGWRGGYGAIIVVRAQR